MTTLNNIREAARSGVGLDGSDACALEQALMAAEQQLAVVQAEIERLQGRLSDAIAVLLANNLGCVSDALGVLRRKDDVPTSDAVKEAQRSNPVPTDYRCSDCGVVGVKLWRPFNSADVLRCAACALLSADADKDARVDDNGMTPSRHGLTDQVGGMAPAVPTPDGKTYWGYTSTPDDAIAWWRGLPTSVSAQPSASIGEILQE